MIRNFSIIDLKHSIQIKADLLSPFFICSSSEFHILQDIKGQHLWLYRCFFTVLTACLLLEEPDEFSNVDGTSVKPSNSPEPASPSSSAVLVGTVSRSYPTRHSGSIRARQLHFDTDSRVLETPDDAGTVAALTDELVTIDMCWH
jgi:hypothetical protein